MDAPRVGKQPKPASSASAIPDQGSALSPAAGVNAARSGVRASRHFEASEARGDLARRRQAHEEALVQRRVEEIGIACALSSTVQGDTRPTGAERLSRLRQRVLARIATEPAV